MPSSKHLFSTLVQETLTYMKTHCHPSERVILGKAPPAPPIKKGHKPPEAPPALEPAPQAKVEASPQEVSHIKKALLELAPDLYSDAPIPDDTLAEKRRHAWKEKQMAAEITLLSFESHSKAHLFLQNLATAIDVRLRPARVALATLLENENRWNHFFESSALKHLISFPLPLDDFPHLLRAYRENPQAAQKFLNTTPLFLLRPFSEYQADPLLKKELWTTLCTQLSS